MLVITYRQGTDERARRALDLLQITFRCCGADNRISSYQNNVPSSCNMYNAGCLPHTLFFLDICMNTLAYTLLFFSLIKLIISLFFYTFICIYQRQRQNLAKKRRYINDDSSLYRYSSSFDSSSTDNIPKRSFITSIELNQDEHDNDYIEKQQEYDLSDTTIISPSNVLPSYYENKITRKLSSISEKTEKTETDESDPDLLRSRNYKPERIPMITTIVNPSISTTKKIPIVKIRRKIPRDEDNDSGLD